MTLPPSPEPPPRPRGLLIGTAIALTVFAGCAYFAVQHVATLDTPPPAISTGRPVTAISAGPAIPPPPPPAAPVEAPPALAAAPEPPPPSPPVLARSAPFGPVPFGVVLPSLPAPPAPPPPLPDVERFRSPDVAGVEELAPPPVVAVAEPVPETVPEPAPEPPPVVLAAAPPPPPPPRRGSSPTPDPEPPRQESPPAERIRICAGSPTGNYTFAARAIVGRLAALGDVEVITTAGSGENLRRLLAGDCQMGFSQADVLALRIADQPLAMAALDAFKRVYAEVTHILCPVASGLTSTAGFDGRTRLIVGAEGSGTAETWRVFTQAVPALGAVQRINDPVSLVAVNRVKDSRDTCMLWISGLNSGDMQAANRMSANTPDGRRAMRLVSVTHPELRNLRLPDGQPIYRFEPIDARSGGYDNLLEARTVVNAEGRRWTQPGVVTVPVVDAVLVVRRDFLRVLPGRGAELVAAVEEAGPEIWARVSPKRAP